MRFTCLDDEQVGVGREDQAAMRRSAVEEGALGEGLAGGEVGERSEGGEGVADAEEEVAVAEAPEVLAVIVEAPVGAGEDAAGGEFEEDGVDVAVLIVGGSLGRRLMRRWALKVTRRCLSST